MRTVKVKLLTSRCSDRGAQKIGAIIEVPEDEAKRMLAKGQCEEVPETQSNNPRRQ